MSEEKKEQEKKVEEIKKEAEGRKCPVNKALYYMNEFLNGPMCGRCLPCSLGSYEARVRLENIVEGRGTEADLVALRRIMDEMLEGSLCKKGKDTAKFVLEWMATDVYREHINGRCPDRECIAFIEYRVIPEKCVMCGLCKEACKYNAIIGEKKVSYLSGYLPFEIRQKRCTKCGDCLKVCPTEAIVIVDIKQIEAGAGV
ncbi:MAG: hypothetical protein OHK0032_08690 [Thermodesulfovibrionales bacterium]